jgi:hypothetical protein
MADYPGALHTFIEASMKAGQPLSDEHVASHVELAAELRAVQEALGAGAGPAQYAVTSASASSAYSVPLAPAIALTITGNVTLTLPSPAAGATILLRITGAFSVTWPASVASPPAYTSGALYAVTTLDGGTSWIAKVVS